MVVKLNGPKQEVVKAGITHFPSGAVLVSTTGYGSAFVNPAVYVKTFDGHAVRLADGWVVDAQQAAGWYFRALRPDETVTLAA